jgi:DNA-binding transcriptional LysR family regulator
VCTLPERLARALHGDFELSPLSFPLLPYSLCMAWHARGADDPGLLWLRAELEAVVAENG